MSVSTSKVLPPIHTCSFTDVRGCLVLQGQSRIVAAETCIAQKLKIFILLSDFLHKKCADPCYEVELRTLPIQKLPRK